MREIVNHKKCYGCMACVNICPRHCIEMEEDKEGFFYPVIRESDCIDCKLCASVCPARPGTVRPNSQKVKVYAATHKNIKIRKNSSSGGAFYAFAGYVIRNSGVVYGAVQRSDLRIEHRRVSDMKQLRACMRSKYLQSRIGDCYEQAKKDLESGRIVLFSGTPCQIAGLYGYLKKEYDNLYTLDVVCHGVPSGKVFQKYISEMEEKQKSRVAAIVWRDKSAGWNPNRVRVSFENGQTISQVSQDNPFQKGFLHNLYLRPSCYQCGFNKIPRTADISLADYWGYKGILNLRNQNTGISLVAISSLKGKELFKSVRKELIWHRAALADAIKKSRHFSQPPKRNKNRNRFMEEFEQQPFHVLSRKYL